MAIRKKRKMTEEQRKAAAERLAIAREKRLKNNPPEYKNIHDSVLALDKSDSLSMHNVKQWIKNQRGLLAAEKRNVRSNKGSEAKVAAISGYINNLEAYLRGGDYQDMFWGEFAENKVSYVCTHPAYDENGLIKRNVGTYYQDIHCVWTQEMANAQR